MMPLPQTKGFSLLTVTAEVKSEVREGGRGRGDGGKERGTERGKGREGALVPQFPQVLMQSASCPE